MTNRVEIFARNMDVNERLDGYITKRTQKLDRYLPDIEEARVDLAYVRTARSAADRNVAQITVRGKKFVLRAEERADDILVAFDRALDKMERQISRYKGKRYRGRGDGMTIAEVTTPPGAAEASPADLEEAPPQIVRRKRFIMLPMDELEAIEQMKLLGHEDFFVFYNANTNAVNVLYRRRDGTYGLLEPELG